MKNLRIVCLLAILSLGTVAFAQGAGAAAAPSPKAQASPAPAATLSSVVDRQVASYEKNVVEAAEAMPAEKFDFNPSTLNIPNSAYKDVRSYSQLVKHIATANYRLWAGLAGEKVPENIKGTNGPDELKTKDEIIKFLKDSFAVGHQAAKSLTSENALEQVPFFRGTQPRIYVVTAPVIHAADEYGQMVEYLRMNGITPPASRGN
jgi:uncharacterized damage-inducible protein DinB